MATAAGATELGESGLLASFVSRGDSLGGVAGIFRHLLGVSLTLTRPILGDGIEGIGSLGRILLNGSRVLGGDCGAEGTIGTGTGLHPGLVLSKIRILGNEPGGAKSENRK